jgi:hypothetical protein
VPYCYTPPCLCLMHPVRLHAALTPDAGAGTAPNASVLEVGSPLPLDRRDVPDILMDAITQRCADRSIAVRAKALDALTSVAESCSQFLPSHLEPVLVRGQG